MSKYWISKIILFYYSINQKFSVKHYMQRISFWEICHQFCSFLVVVSQEDRIEIAVRAIRAIWYRIHSFACLARDEYNKSSYGEFHESSRRELAIRVCINERCSVHTSAHNDTVSKSTYTQSNRPDRNLTAKIRQPSCHRVNPNSNVTIVNESFSKSYTIYLFAFASVVRITERYAGDKVRRRNLKANKTEV